MNAPERCAPTCCSPRRTSELAASPCAGHRTTPVTGPARREEDMRRTFAIRIVSCAAAALLAGCAAQPAGPRAGLAKIQHIVVIYAENRSFDHLYGMFPGADGVA